MRQSTLATPTLRDHIRVLRRRWWILLAAVVAVPGAAVALSLQQHDLYRATSDVLLPQPGGAGAALAGVAEATSAQQAERYARRQAEIAASPALAAQVLKDVALTGVTANELLERTDVSARKDVDVLAFSVTARSAAEAMRLASAYADAYTRFQPLSDLTAIDRALRDTNRRLARLREAGAEDSPLYASLVDRAEQMRTLKALRGTASVLRPATTAEQVQPRTFELLFLGLALGLVLGVAAAFVRESLDGRVTSGEEVADRLGVPLLGRLPAPPRRQRAAGTLVMMAKPRGVAADAFRALRSNLELVRLERDLRTLLVTSATEGEGKSTTAANLAVALARAGRRVILVDLDLRRPSLHKLFGLGELPGVTDLAVGRTTLAEALVQIPLSGELPREDDAHLGEDVLELMPAGRPPPNPGEFVQTRAVASILESLADRADTVVIDVPPLLAVADALALTPRVDAVLAVARLNVVRRPMLRELRRLLESCPADKIGVVLTDAEHDLRYGYDDYGEAEHPPLTLVSAYEEQA